MHTCIYTYMSKADRGPGWVRCKLEHCGLEVRRSEEHVTSEELYRWTAVSPCACMGSRMNRI